MFNMAKTTLNSFVSVLWLCNRIPTNGLKSNCSQQDKQTTENNGDLLAQSGLENEEPFWPNLGSHHITSHRIASHRIVSYRIALRCRSTFRGCHQSPPFKFCGKLPRLQDEALIQKDLYLLLLTKKRINQTKSKRAKMKANNKGQNQNV